MQTLQWSGDEAEGQQQRLQPQPHLIVHEVLQLPQQTVPLIEGRVNLGSISSYPPNSAVGEDARQPATVVVRDIRRSANAGDDGEAAPAKRIKVARRRLGPLGKKENTNGGGGDSGGDSQESKVGNLNQVVELQQQQQQPIQLGGPGTSAGTTVFFNGNTAVLNSLFAQVKVASGSKEDIQNSLPEMSDRVLVLNKSHYQGSHGGHGGHSNNSPRVVLVDNSNTINQHHHAVTQGTLIGVPTGSNNGLAAAIPAGAIVSTTGPNGAVRFVRMQAVNVNEAQGAVLQPHQIQVQVRMADPVTSMSKFAKTN